MNIVTFSWHSETADSNEVSAGMRLAIPVLELMSLSEDVARAFAAPGHFLSPCRLSVLLWGSAPECYGISIIGRMAHYRSETRAGFHLITQIEAASEILR
jgi:hypothetical protein